jgi:hypothetical protein
VFDWTEGWRVVRIRMGGMSMIVREKGSVLKTEKNKFKTGKQMKPKGR